MFQKQVTVRNYPGIHAHPAVLFVKKAATFKSTVKVSNGTLTVNGKSIMGILMLAAETGTILTIVAEGPDEEQATDALVRLVDSKFVEEPA